MNQNLSMLGLTPEIESKIKVDINTTFAKVLNRQWKNLLINKKTMISAIVMLVVGFFCIIFGFVSNFIGTKPEQMSAGINLPLVIIGGILSFTGIILLAIQSYYRSKIRNLLTVDLLNYWKMIAHNYPNWEFIALDNQFTLPITEEFMNTLKASVHFHENAQYNRWVEKVLIGRFKDKLFNIGSIIEKIITKSNDDKTESVTYNRYLYYIQEINNDFQTKIIPENFMTKLKQKFHKNIQLESSEFEKLFAVDYHDPIALRKLLSPKVMSRMVDLATDDRKIPTIELDTNRIALMKYYSSVNVASGNGTVCFFPFASNAKNCFTNTLKMFENDFHTISTFVAWVNAFDFTEQP